MFNDMSDFGLSARFIHVNSDSCVNQGTKGWSLLRYANQQSDVLR
jgi:hypothetical protein